MNMLYAWRRLCFLLKAVWLRLQSLLIVVKAAYYTDKGFFAFGKFDWSVALLALLLLGLAITPLFCAWCISSPVFRVLNLAVVIFCLWNMVTFWRAAMRLISVKTFALVLLPQALALRYETAIREATRALTGDRPAGSLPPNSHLLVLRGELINDLANRACEIAYASFIIFALHFTFAVLLASLLAYGATAHFQLCDAFNGLCLQDGLSFLRHVYYVMVSIVTIGYGDIFPASGNNDYGSYFGIFLCVQSVGLLVLGAPTIFSATQYRIQQFQLDVDNWMRELGAPV